MYAAMNLNLVTITFSNCLCSQPRKTTVYSVWRLTNACCNSFCKLQTAIRLDAFLSGAGLRSRCRRVYCEAFAIVLHFPGSLRAVSQPFGSILHTQAAFDLVVSFPCDFAVLLRTSFLGCSCFFREGLFHLHDSLHLRRLWVFPGTGSSLSRAFFPQHIILSGLLLYLDCLFILRYGPNVPVNGSFDRSEYGDSICIARSGSCDRTYFLIRKSEAL